MTLCEHTAKLSQKKPYPGRFCIYCGKEIARIEPEDGQLVLRSGDAAKYVAVVFRNQQKAVKEINLDAAKPLIWFEGQDDELPLDISTLIISFQKSDEVFSIE